MKNIKAIAGIFALLFALSCANNENLPDDRSDEADILSFSLEEEVEPANINSIDHTIVSVVNENANLQSLTPTITISEKATMAPLSGQPQDFSVPVVYTVTSESGDIINNWTVEVSKLQAPLANLAPMGDFENWYTNTDTNTLEPGESDNQSLKTSNTSSIEYSVDQSPNVLRVEGEGYENSTAIKLITKKSEADLLGTPLKKIDGIVETPASARIPIPAGKKPIKIQFYAKYIPGDQLIDDDTSEVLEGQKDQFQIDIFGFKANNGTTDKHSYKFKETTELKSFSIDLPQFSEGTTTLFWRFSSSDLGTYAFGSTLWLDHIKVVFQ